MVGQGVHVEFAPSSWLNIELGTSFLCRKSVGGEISNRCSFDRSVFHCILSRILRYLALFYGSLCARPIRTSNPNASTRANQPTLEAPGPEAIFLFFSFAPWSRAEGAQQLASGCKLLGHQVADTTLTTRSLRNMSPEKAATR